MAEVACPAHCATWASNYFGYCLCSSKDGLSLALGMISVVSWALAEVPQIHTNFKNKSTEGLSFAFLLTWIVGDFFNMFGCWLEPATLPTQFYMAVLYTVTTLTLTLQSVYYGHIYHRLKSNKQFSKTTKPNQLEVAGDSVHQNSGDEKLMNGSSGHRLMSGVFESGSVMTSPIPLPAIPRSRSAGQDSFYTSARSLTTSHTPTRSFVSSWKASTLNVEDVEEPLLGGSLPTRPVHLSKTKNLLCIVPATTFIVGIMNISSTRNTARSLAVEISNRKLLQFNGEQKINSGGSGNLGTNLGWAMAAIYMGGRLPQICLNIKRGNVEGLNPLMFMFALLGNTTYVASILVNSLDWSKIFPNLPWLVDAGGCSILDSFILLQFIYFQYRQSHHRVTKHGDTHPTLV
ncbi:probable vacuolar amino acid transporter YPQ1 [Amaranthus tricolor]|uniref:probable vacuolar amino acid transporter YPQ1 n=1 Tax=Amaranthus tricolor TaxID=29722 RepID=UPI0025890B82|nr:probable vacuolar amino acid transporter YPQ1 [Amaranthus tricolor]